jgi:hypothetical protein
MEPLEDGERHDQVSGGCAKIRPDVDSPPERCYACNSDSTTITNSQKSKWGEKALCKECTQQGKSHRFEKFPVDDVASSHPVQIFHDAISYADVDKVKECLESGMDPNAVRQLHHKDLITGRYLPIWNGDGSPYPEIDEGQPNTPLKLVVFRISDCFLEDEDLIRFEPVAKLLVAAGASCDEAIVYAKSRYGEDCFEKLREGNLFHNVLAQLLPENHV